MRWSSSRGPTSFPTGWGRSWPPSRGRSRPINWWWAGRGTWTIWRCRIEVREELFFDKMTKQREMLQEIAHKLAQGIGVQPRVKLVEPGSLNRDAETSPLVIDLRQGVC